MTTSAKRILIAEDDRFLRRAFEISVRQMGYSVTATADGEEALEVIGKQVPDLILLDLLMPKVNGMEVLRNLKSNEATQSIPVLILTNSSMANDIDEVKKLGASGYFIKSNLSLEDLGTQIRQLLKD